LSSIVTSQGVVHYETYGRGRPVVLLHGWLGSWGCWSATMEALAPSYRTYALDFWGFGESDKRRESYYISDFIALVDQFLERLGIQSAPIIGHSMGGTVALSLALGESGRCRLPDRWAILERVPQIGWLPLDRIPGLELPFPFASGYQNLCTVDRGKLARVVRSLDARPVQNDAGVLSLEYPLPASHRSHLQNQHSADASTRRLWQRRQDRRSATGPDFSPHCQFAGGDDEWRPPLPHAGRASVLSPHPVELPGKLNRVAGMMARSIERVTG
jgi:pimeloyl-ACP methyl ester carboxylesterase